MQRGLCSLRFATRLYTTETERALVESVCKKGTVMTGVNVLQKQSDPIALDDAEYPPWLWTLLEPKKTVFTEEEKLSRDYIRYASKLMMKENAMKKKIGK